MFVIEPPYPQFFELDGRPLDAGYIFIGVENQNPETAPIPVYWDAGLTQPAAQPLRTKNGMIARNGAPAFVYCNPAYSLTVRNSRQQLVYYAAAPQSSSVGFIQAGEGAVSRTLQDKMRDFLSVRDYGALGDGSDQADEIEKALAEAGAKGKNLFFPAGRYGLTRTVIIPAGVSLAGEGRLDMWGETTGLGSEIFTIGTGNPQRWTDITGADAPDDTPMLVAGGNGVYLRNLALMTDIAGGTPWSMGILFPCVKQCGFSSLVGDGWTDGAVYLDATWSNRNATLRALHPSVMPSTGMNEFVGSDFYLRGRGTAGFGIKIQGTTRAGNSVGSSAEWQWGWGGTSDVRFENGRLGGTGSGGGCFSHDAQLFGVNVFAQGVTVRDVSFRLSGSGRYHANLDRSNRVIFDGCYGETVGGVTPVFAVTSRTAASTDGIIRVNDKLNSNLWLDGASTGFSGSTVPWSATRCVVVYRADGREWTPNFDSSRADSQLMRFKSFSSLGQVRFGYDNGTTVTDYLRLQNNMIRPETDLGLDLGNSGARWGRMHVGWINVGAAEVTQTIDSGSITATQTATRVDTEGGAGADNLGQIDGGEPGDLLTLRTVSNSRVVTLVDNLGNLRLNGDCVLGDTTSTITLQQRGGFWLEVSRSLNG